MRINVLPEILPGDVATLLELTEVADPHVSLQAHEDGHVDGAHHGDLDQGQEPGQQPRVQLRRVEAPQVGQAVEHCAPDHH